MSFLMALGTDLSIIKMLGYQTMRAQREVNGFSGNYILTICFILVPHHPMTTMRKNVLISTKRNVWNDAFAFL